MKRPLLDRRGHGAANIAQIGWDDDGQLAFAYLESADLLAVNWTSNRRLVLPMFGNYRHSIELALKAVIREAAACGRRDGLNDAELDPDKVNENWQRVIESIFLATGSTTFSTVSSLAAI